MDDIPLAPDDAWRKSRPGAAAPAGGPSHAPPPRRNFFVSFFAGLLGMIAGVVPLAAGIAVYLDPLRRQKAAGKAIAVTSLDKLPDNSKGDVYLGQFPVIADRQDAWNYFPDERIGSVYLVLPKGSDQIKAMNAICPHLGCMVDKQSADDGFKFRCPCHTSEFRSDGARIMPCVSPRDMDELECRVEKRDGRLEVLVVFQNFQPGLAEKKAKT